ncbi:MAG: hypothetical protein LBL97_05000 [Prevotellaceae bacterium]|jgi:hypothetical protein|nr:hypothetical protein [Prevotellaceae bacterium]
MNIDKIRNVLNILFMALAVVAVVLYFVFDEDKKPFMYVCGAALFFKLVEFYIRFTNR